MMYTARELEVMLHITRAVEIIRAETSGVYRNGVLQNYVTTLDERKLRWADNADDWCVALNSILAEVEHVA